MTDKEKELDRFNGGKMDIVKIPLCNYCRYNQFPQSCVLSYDRLKAIEIKECKGFNFKDDIDKEKAIEMIGKDPTK